MQHGLRAEIYKKRVDTGEIVAQKGRTRTDVEMTREKRAPAEEAEGSGGTQRGRRRLRPYRTIQEEINAVHSSRH